MLYSVYEVFVLGRFRFFLNPNFRPLTIFCDCIAWFVSDLVGTPNSWFSHAQAQMIILPLFFRQYAGDVRVNVTSQSSQGRSVKDVALQNVLQWACAKT